MKIWKLNMKKKFEINYSISFMNVISDCNILKLNEREFVTSSYYEQFLTFWNSINYSKIITIKNIDTNWSYRMMCLLEDDILCVGGIDSNGFYLIKISTHQLINKIKGPKGIYSIYKCFDGNFLCSIVDENGSNNIIKCNFENLCYTKISEIKQAHNKDIITCIELKDKIIVSGGGDNLIKIWSF